MDLLTRLHHRHLVNLVGFCPEPGKLSLAYEFVPGGTLREALEDSNKSQKLNLESRLKIALGAAKGLEYLHLGATPAVIHRYNHTPPRTSLSQFLFLMNFKIGFI